MKDTLALDGELIKKHNAETGQWVTSPFFICPFVSGTFEGFDEEFTYLYSDIFTKLDQLCQSKGLRFTPSCDRRTAIETRTSSSLQLTHALDCIKRCSPYFMAIFGQQYGAHRSVKETVIEMKAGHGRQSVGPSNLSLVDVNIVTASKRGHWWLLDKKWQYCSMLELEIQAAALENDSVAKHCFFYIRDFKNNYLKQRQLNDMDGFADEFSLFEAESEYAEKKLDNLKLRISNKGWPVKYFSNPYELGEMILQDWTKIINLVCPSPYTQTEFNDAKRWNEAVGIKHESKYHFYDELNKVIQALDDHCSTTVTAAKAGNPLIEQSDELFETAPQQGFGLFSSCMPRKRPMDLQNQGAKPDKRILVLVGDPGSGKTSIIAKWLHRFKETQPQTVILSEFMGTTHDSRDIGFVMRKCVKIIRELVFKTKMTQSELLEDTKSFCTLASMFRNCLTQVPCTIVFDSLNDLKPSMGQDISFIKKLSWLPDILPETCRVVFTTRRSDLSFKSLSAREDTKIIWMPIPSKDDQITIVKRAMSHRQTSIGKANAEKLTVNRLSEKPLFLVTLSGLISSCSSQREVDKVVEKCTELRTFRDFWKTTFMLWTLRFSWKKNSNGQPGTCRSINSGWVSDALRIIAVSRNGLLVTEILHILYLIGYKGKCTITPYDWSLFQHAATDAFNVLPDGQICISHIEIRHAVKFFLLGMPLPSATASASSLGTLNHFQQYHAVLANYFLNFGCVDRKIVELPWQLEQSCDLLMLSQVMSKPRFFEAFYEKAMTHHQFMIDLIYFWKILDKGGFSPAHYMQLMVEKTTERPKSDLFMDSWRMDTRGAEGLKTISTLSSSSMKRPSIAITTLDDRRQSTIGTRSESGDFDIMSEIGNGFFVTETELLVDHRGWNPKLEGPECPIEETIFSQDESCTLNFNACMMLKHLGEEFDKECKDSLSALSQRLMELQPLSTKQQKIHAKTLCNLAQLSEDDKDFVRCLSEDCSDILLSLSNQFPLKPRGSMIETKIITLRYIAESLIEMKELDKAEDVLKDADSYLKQYQGITQSLETKFTNAKLYFCQGLYGQAEENLKQVLMEKLNWYGAEHIVVAGVLHYLADLYAVLEAQGLSKNRLSMLTYREAFRIYQKKMDKRHEAIMLHKIGIQLKREGSLISTNEAKECLENAMDIYTTEIGPAHSDISSLREDVKKISDNLRKGHYKFGWAKPPDKRTDDFLYSSMTWHDFDLRKIVKRRKLRSAPPAYGNRSRISTRDTFRIHTPRSLPEGTKGLSQREDRKNNGVVKSEEKHEIMKLDVVPPATPRPLELEESKSVLEEDVVVIPGGRESRLSGKMRITDGSEKSVSIRLPGFKRNTIPLIEERSEWSSAFSDATTPRRYSARISHEVHRRMCQPTSGANGLSMTVHGPHSTISSILEPPRSAKTVRDPGLMHKSAWYNVPGRYHVPGKALPPKHNQIRPDSRLSSRRSHRSYHTM